MIKPDVMDRVPEGEGYYLYRAKSDLAFELYGWLVCEIYLSVEGLRIKRSTMPDHAHYSTLLDEIKDDYIFSERIAEPTTDVDKFVDS